MKFGASIGIHQKALRVHFVGIATEIILVLVRNRCEEGGVVGRVDVIAKFGHQVDEQISVSGLIVFTEMSVDVVGHRGLRPGNFLRVFAEKAGGHSVKTESEQ